MAPNEHPSDDLDCDKPPAEGSAKVVEVHYDLKKLPSWAKLNEEVKKIEAQSTWWEKYGVDWCHIIVIASMVPGALHLMRSERTFDKIVGFCILGAYHCIFANKSGHIASHNGLCESKTWGAFWTRFFVEFIGSYSSKLGVNSHVKVHHPHTNIIGLGDSSMWRAPCLSRIPYMFIAPILLPHITPAFAYVLLIKHKMWLEILKFTAVMGSGLALHIWVIVNECGYSIPKAIAFLFFFRAVFSIPFIHINIFQHIGLPMYSQEHRPARMYQMSTGVLNIQSIWILDRTFGHSLISCHVEHHFFPRLSDNMCLKIKPVVRDYLLKNDLPYNEDSYMNRLKIFVKDYDSLMVDAPPITHFIGIQ